MKLRTLSVFVGLAVAFDGAQAVAASTAPAADVDAGDVVIVDPVNNNRGLDEGDSTSAFSLRLPDGAVCQGDSANDDWRVQSFLVPADTDVGALRYRATRPDGDAYRSLRHVDGDHYTMEFTDPNTGPGQPGRMVAVPPLTMAYFPTGSIPPGSYRIGIACTDPDWFVQRYWDVRVDLVAAPDVEPGGLRWNVAHAGTPDGINASSGSSGSGVIAPLVIVLGLVVGAFVFLRRRRPVAQPHKEPA